MIELGSQQGDVRGIIPDSGKFMLMCLNSMRLGDRLLIQDSERSKNYIIELTEIRTKEER